MITYVQFIDEIRQLVEDAKAIKSVTDMHMHPQFRKWRSHLDGVMSHAKQAGIEFSAPIRVQARRFGKLRDRHTQKECHENYCMEMADTINELEHLIESFDKYGEPLRKEVNHSGRSESETSLEWPNKITLSWLFHNAPISVWAWFIGLIFASFVAGTQVAGTQLYKDIVSSPNHQNDKVINEPNKSN